METQNSELFCVVDDLAALLQESFPENPNPNTLKMLHQLVDFEYAQSEDPDNLAASLDQLNTYGQILSSALHRSGDPARALLAAFGACTGSGMIAALAEPDCVRAFLAAAQSHPSAPVGIGDPRQTGTRETSTVLTDEDRRRLEDRNRRERGMRPLQSEQDAESDTE